MTLSRVVPNFGAMVDVPAPHADTLRRILDDPLNERLREEASEILRAIDSGESDERQAQILAGASAELRTLMAAFDEARRLSADPNEVVDLASIGQVELS